MVFDVIPTSDEKWIICGGRNFLAKDIFTSAMSDLIRLRGVPAKIIQGGANGADSMAREWAQKKAVDCCTVFADWEKHGKAAGPIRNQEMLDRHKPTLIVAFPGGRGTDDMIRRGRKSGIDVAEIKLK